MEWALNSNLQHVHASSSDAVRGLSYTCPRCRKETFLRKGKKRIAHFAHVSGQTNKDCELYTPPTIYASKVEERTLDNLHEKTLDLYVEVAQDRWTLNIKIPSAVGQYMGNAFLTFPFAWEGERTIPLSSIRTSGKKVRIRLQTQLYKVMVNGDIKDEWKRKVTNPVKGLDEITPTVFYFSRLGGRRLLQDIPLQWGGTYVLIWDDQTMKNLTSIPHLIAHQKLKKMNSWSAMIIKLPTSPDNFLEQWIRKYLNRSIVAPMPLLRVVSPVPSRVIDQEVIVISSTDKVIIAVVGVEGAKKWSTLYIQNIGENQLTRHLGNGETPILLLIGKLPIGRTDIWLDDDRQGVLRLICQDTIKSLPQISGVVFRGVYPAGTEEAYSLHSRDAIKFFEMIQDYRFTLTDVYLPSNVSLLIKTQINETFVRKESPTQIALTLNHLLRQGEHVYLDAGGFGNLEIMPLSERTTHTISMSPGWRERMKWILLTLNTMHHKENMIRNDSLKRSDIKEISNVNKLDQELLFKISNIEFIPKTMLPYVKASISEFLRTVSLKNTDLGWVEDGNEFY